MQGLGTAIDEDVGKRSTKLLADDATNNDTQKLQTDLLGIEAEFRDEDLRDLDGKEDGAEAEDKGVGDGGDDDGGMFGEREGCDEFDWLKRRGVDAAEGGVFGFEGGEVVVGAHGIGSGADVARLGAEEEIEDELDGVDLDVD